ncbi:MAG: permease [Akkermansiaceae bacterium]|nr:permease [Akkermansiaceae bacterium]
MRYLSILADQALQILPYWALGILLGSAISVFGKEKLHRLLGGVQARPGGLVLASAIGIASPLCMYGTIPIAAALAHQGARQDTLAAFMMSSVLLNPQLLVYTASLGEGVLAARLVSCLLCGVGAGLLVRLASRRGHEFFRFSGVGEPGVSRDVHPDPLRRYLLNVWRNLRATGPWFLAGVLLAAAFLYLLPHAAFGHLPGAGSSHLPEVVGMALVGIPFYVCGGGATPLMAGWMQLGLSLGGVVAFTLTGAGTKITNLSALKMVLGMRNFLCYIAYVTLFAIAAGVCSNLFSRI